MVLFFIISTALLVTLFYYYVVRPHKYWERRGVPQAKTTWLLGDLYLYLFRRESTADLVQRTYNGCPGTRFSGIYQFTTPTLIVKDPELIKQIGIKDFDNFPDHRTYVPEDADPLWGKNLFALTGQKWRIMRPILTPAFTSSKIKTMYHFITKCAEDLVSYYLNKNQGVIELKMKDLFSHFANDVIASCAFGLEVDSLNDPSNEFFLMGNQVHDFSGFWKNFKLFGYMIIPSLYSMLKIRLYTDEQRNFFYDLVRETIATREKDGIVRPDMIQLLMEARDGSNKNEDLDSKDADSIQYNGRKRSAKLTDEDIAAQALVFFMAGFDSVSLLMCFMSYEIAVNQPIQDRLRKEMKDSLKGSTRISYEDISKMKYLDMVISETLRKWPIHVEVDRVCDKSYTIQPAEPNEKPVVLEKGTVIWIPIFPIHRDPKYYPDPEKFDPERFSEENKGKIDPNTYLPFGIGPRNCIGLRFALLECKILFCQLLLKFEIIPTKNTKIPLEISKKTFNLSCDDGFCLSLKRLK